MSGRTRFGLSNRSLAGTLVLFLMLCFLLTGCGSGYDSSSGSGSDPDSSVEAVSAL